MAAPRIPLTRDRVLDAAIALVDAQGIDALSMRRLGQALGVEAMSLYNHVANKGDLVDAIVDRVVGEIDLPVDAADWETAIRRCAVSAHETFLRHPWACSFAMSPGTQIPSAPTARMRMIEWLLGTLRDGGFSPALAYDAYHAIDSHILGFTLWQLGHAMGTANVDDAAAKVASRLPAEEFPHLLEHIRQHLEAPPGEGARAFELGLDLLLDGLKRARDAMGAGGFEPP